MRGSSRFATCGRVECAVVAAGATLAVGGSEAIARPAWRAAFVRVLAAENQPFEVRLAAGIGRGALPWGAIAAWAASVAALQAAAGAAGRHHAAQAERSGRNMPVELANRLAAGTVAAGAGGGCNVTAAVVDHVGPLRAPQRVNNAGPREIGAAQARAFTAASAKNSALAMMGNAQQTRRRPPGRHPGFLWLGGGADSAILRT